MAIGYILALCYGLLCIAISAVAYKIGVPKRFTRKIVHILVGFEWLILYLCFDSAVHYLIVCIAFTALLLVDYKRKLLPMMSSDGDNAPGTVFYGVSMSIMALVCCFYPLFVYAFGIAVFCTSFGDGFAGVLGSLIKKYNPKIYKSKTLMGALANFAFSALTVTAFSHIFGLNISLAYTVCIALLSVGLELIGEGGLDNIILPLGVGAFSAFAMRVPDVAVNYVIPIVLTPFVILLVNKYKLLTPMAVFTAVAMDVIISLAFGNFGFILLLSFMLLGAVVDKIKKKASSAPDHITEKGDRRDEFQVLANGLAAMFSAMLYIVGYDMMFVIAFSTALTEAFADTCASGFGVFSKNAYDIVRFKRIDKGLSGGVSLIGTISSLAAAFIFALIPLAFGVVGAVGYILIAVVAFLGALFDSVLGSVMQVKYICNNCGKLTEKRIHCEAVTEYKSGIKFITNDTVNLFSTIFSAILAAVFYNIFII